MALLHLEVFPQQHRQDVGIVHVSASLWPFQRTCKTFSENQYDIFREPMRHFQRTYATWQSFDAVTPIHLSRCMPLRDHFVTYSKTATQLATVAVMQLVLLWHHSSASKTSFGSDPATTSVVRIFILFIFHSFRLPHSNAS